MDYSQFLMMPQELGLLVVMLLVFFYDLAMPKNLQSKLPVFASAMMALFTVVQCFMGCNVGDAFAGMFETTTATVVFKTVLSAGVLIVFLQSTKWSNNDFVAVRRGEFYTLILASLLGMFFMISARHFLLFIIGLELASLPLVALVAFDKRYYESHEAAAKYLFTAVFSSAVFMFGLSFVYGLSGSLYFDEISYAVAGGNSAVLVVALAFVIAGIGFKLSLVPFHLWTADVYQGAPTAVTSYLSVISKGSAAFAFFIILAQVFGSVYSQVWEWMLYALIILTITIGNLFAIRQRNLKRFLAFSSISQAGYIMLGVVANTSVGLGSLMYYVLVYIASNLAAFGVIQSIENNSGKVSIDDYNGLYQTNPRLAFTMMLAMFSLAGIPPFAGFFSKFFIFSAALQPGTTALYVLVLIALINTIISLYYYLLVVKAMFIVPNDAPIATFKSSCSERLAMILCVLGIIFLGIVSFFYTHLIAAAA